MGKVNSTLKITGTSGNDVLRVPNGYDLASVSFDGGRGSDTLDLSTYQPGATPGVRVDLIAGYIHSSGSVVELQPFTGVSGSMTYTAPAVRGTIVNVENLIGTTGNDSLTVDWGGVTTRIDGGAGNDQLTINNAAGATLVGGTGSDWLQSIVAGSTLVGGTLDANGAHGDGSMDIFRVGVPSVTILDFEVGIDRLIFGNGHSLDASFASGYWMDDGHGGSQFVVNGAVRVDLAGVSVSAASGIQFGFDYISENGVLRGQSTNDVLRAGSNSIDNVQVGSGSGNDLVTQFDTAVDSLTFTNDLQVTWANSYVNGQSALLGTFTGGSIALTGLTTSDLSAMHINGLVTPYIVDPHPHLGFWSYASDATLV